jgi:lysyl-tRNA synthetase class 2
MTAITNEFESRRQKLETIAASGEIPYKDRYAVTHDLDEALRLEDGTEGVSVAGRIVGLRKMGKMTFGHIGDIDGRFQFLMKKDFLEDSYQRFKDTVDTGDYIGLRGEIFTTRTQEKTLVVREWILLSKSLRPLPEKFHGITDKEQKYRKRYLDLISSRESVRRFQLRNTFINTVRGYLNRHKFVEIDTPVLINKASGALAKPFKTHYNALDIDVFLRIAPETYLKRAIAGGYNRVYEFARCFRNEGIDPSHLPDFTMLEYYAAYWDYQDNMAFTEDLIKTAVRETIGSLQFTYQGTAIDLDGAWARKSFRELILQDSGIDLTRAGDKAKLVEAITKNGIVIERDIKDPGIGYGTLVDLLYKKVSRPKLIAPTFLIEHPLDISPLARKNDANPSIVDRFQLVINGWEVVNAYSELIDPIDQMERFQSQLQARERGDLEAMETDEDFVTCMEYGMPPMSGWGMGIDRFVALLTDTEHLRDVVLFPLLRPDL